MQTIEIDGLFNVRATSASAPWLVRSGTTEGLTAAGEAELRRLGVTRVLDLREPGETGRPAHGLPTVSVPLYGSVPPATGRLEDIYDGLLRRRAGALAAAVAAIAETEGGVLVHCTAGKDRTGLLTALALSAAGVDAETVTADYVRSGSSVRPIREPVARRIAEAARGEDRAEVMRLHLESPPEAIAHALSTAAALGGAAAHLRVHGLTSAQLAQLRDKAARGGGVLSPAHERAGARSEGTARSRRRSA